MPGPTLQTTKAPTLTLSKTGKDLFRVIYQEQKSETEEDKGVTKITVHEIVSKMAFFYEKIRNAVDYQDEHLLRKNAIERILKRLFMTGHDDTEEMARTLIVELIRAGYLDNNKIPETKIKEIADVIDRFVKMRRLILAAGKKEKKEKDQARQWLTNLAATNIEENLSDQRVKQIIGEHMYEIIDSNIVDEGRDEKFTRDKKIQIYLAIYSLLFKYDRAMLEFVLFRYFNSRWNKATDEDIALISQHYQELRDVCEQQINHPFRRQVQKIASRYTVFFSILQDAIEEDPEGAYDKLKNNPSQFKKLVEKYCEKRYKESSGKLRRAAVRSIIYIFLTKAILAIAIEIPAIMLLGDVVKYYSLAINISFPPFLLFLIALATSVPGKDNTKEIQEGIEEIVFEEKREKHPVKLHEPLKRGLITNIIFGFLYFITFLLSFGAVIWGLTQIHFNIVSIIIFLFFLSLISFFGIRIGKFARTYSVLEKKENIFSFIGNFFYVPVISMGKWLSETFSQINVFIFILDFIIEAPFKIFVEIAEQWTAYVRERKEGVVE